MLRLATSLPSDRPRAPAPRRGRDRALHVAVVLAAACAPLATSAAAVGQPAEPTDGSASVMPAAVDTALALLDPACGVDATAPAAAPFGYRVGSPDEQRNLCARTSTAADAAICVLASDPTSPAPPAALAAGCDIDVLADAAGWGFIPRAAWPFAADGVHAVHEMRPVPAALARRAAVHAYLSTRDDILGDVAAAQAAQGAAPADVAALRVLAAASRRDTQAMRAAAEGHAFADDAYLLWVDAELARHRGDPRTALARAEAALALDPLFAAAALTHAAALVALDRADDALTDLEHLRRTFGRSSVYEHWIAALERALR